MYKGALSMAIRRESVYRVSYDTRIPISEQESTIYSPEDCTDTPVHGEDVPPKIGYGCNMLGRLGECTLRQTIEHDADEKHTLHLSCKADKPTYSKAEAETLEHKCRTIHALIRESHANKSRYAQNNEDDLF